MDKQHKQKQRKNQMQVFQLYSNNSRIRDLYLDSISSFDNTSNSILIDIIKD